jgi:DNA-binding winged helix-turn-helix (wHTH) protein
MPVRFGDFAIDFDRRELSDRSGPLHVTPKAFELIQILMESRPKVISQKDLYDRLWPNTFVQPTNLHNLIGELRTVLHDDEHRIIQTKHGVGFAFAGQAFVDDVQAPAAQIVVGGEMFELHDGENFIGRDHKATVRIQAASVSRLHARIVVAGGAATLEDLGSKNGTFLRGQRLRSAAALSDGDDLVFGSVAARFLLTSSLPTETVR